MSATRLPRTRTEAFHFWMLAIATTALVETALVALGAAFPSAGHREGGVSTLRVLAIAAALPLLFLSFARVAESRYQRRPSKAFQIWQFGFYLSGTALVSADVRAGQAPTAEDWWPGPGEILREATSADLVTIAFAAPAGGEGDRDEI